MQVKSDISALLLIPVSPEQVTFCVSNKNSSLKMLITIGQFIGTVSSAVAILSRFCGMGPHNYDTPSNFQIRCDITFGRLFLSDELP